MQYFIDTSDISILSFFLSLQVKNEEIGKKKTDP